MIDEKGRVWFTARVRPPANPDFCKKGSDHPSAKVFPLAEVEPPSRDVRSEDRQVHPDQHLLRHAPPDVRRGCQPHAVDEPAGGPGVVGWLNRKMFEETGDEQKSQGWTRARSSTPTATASATTTSSRTSRSIRPRTSASRGALYAVAAEPARRLDLGHGARVPRRGRPPRSRAPNPPETALAEVYEPPLARATVAARRRHRPQRRGLGRARERPSRELRPAQVQGPLNGPTATGQHCPEGWTLYPLPGAAVQGRDRLRQRRGELLHLGRSVRHVRPRQERADRHRQPERSAAGAGGRQVGRPARAVSDRLLRQVDGRPHRRSRTPAGRARALWSTYATRTPFHMEDGKGTTPKVVQLPAAARPAGAVRQIQQRRA